ncbi:BamA/TamA family outer membrane protein [Mucilaginibacter myungsuensis]|uniref:BamA/TamA family outer membrane protein n=1 Tax=Mucilaginibacter myungsuensis TaxID=649104 RepID=A0A929PUS5_9SPHI|nr:BamA/TamA family outer membrane protein [Mucilaginibacter myungsuensis]MBE9660261.1 BamA/TamA family outer membrane protein [Mucilaginibacter myungsuensis]MDN3600303.1 BamA/TamA family outer membrane protein [Mucilaginibacter myungsuensis]
MAFSSLYGHLTRIAFVALSLSFPDPGFSQTRSSTADSITIAVEPIYDKASKAHRIVFGEGYRKLWSTPVKMRILNIKKEKGGLKITQLGGGQQTKSLRLEDPTGQEWVIRTIQKYPDKALPPTLRKTIAADIIQDQVVAEHPFSAVVVPPLAEALGIPHANPEIVYVPDDPAFGEYQKNFANQVFLFEEREPLDAKKTDNTDKLREKLMEDNDNRLDQKMYLRARLLDMVVGDWDRHSDQWRWEKTKDDTGAIYKPVPRDRDQVFYTTSGIVPWLVSHHLLMSKFQSYESHIRSVTKWNFNARYIDREFMTRLDEQDWREAIQEVQNKLSDGLITRSMKRMPDTIYKMCGNDLIKKMKSRRDELMTTGIEYYRFLAKVVEIVGTDKHEFIDITNEANGKLTVTINKQKKDGEKEQVIYKRTFIPEITNEIRIYGMGGEDDFKVHGRTQPGITVRMIGGNDEDKFKIDSNITGKNNLYVYDRSDEKNKLPKYGNAHIRTSTDTIVNNYNRKSYVYDFFQPLILGSYNRDYGVQFLGKFIWQKQGFRKEPYASQQSVTLNYGFGAHALLVAYNGEFIKAIRKNDLLVNVTSMGPNYTTFFFGVGNNSQFVNSGTMKSRYYRNVYNYMSTDIRLRRAINDWTVTAGIAGAYYNADSDDNANRYLNIYDQQHPDQDVFHGQGIVGLVSSTTLDTRNKSIVPTRGIRWHTSLTAMKSLDNDARSYGQLQTELSFFIRPTGDSTFVIANRIGGGTTIGSAAYFQQLKLGGNQNLRGYYSWRFTGKTMAFNNLELRMKIADVRSYLLPGTIGLIGFNDIGRVWSPGEASDKLHVGYGGGFFFLPGQLVLVQGLVGFSNEGVYPYVSAGFRF